MLWYFAKPLAFSSSHTFPFTPAIPHTFTRWKPLGSRGMNSPAEVLKYRKSWREPSVLSLAGCCECACTLNNRQSVWGLTWKSGWPNNEWTPTSHAFIKNAFITPECCWGVVKIHNVQCRKKETDIACKTFKSFSFCFYLWAHIFYIVSSAACSMSPRPQEYLV